jgi:hypothetical protein
MHHRRIDADHQVKGIDQRRGIGEIRQFFGKVVEHHPAGRAQSLIRGLALLQGQKIYPVNTGERRKLLKRH